MLMQLERLRDLSFPQKNDNNDNPYPVDQHAICDHKAQAGQADIQLWYTWE